MAQKCEKEENKNKSNNEKEDLLQYGNIVLVIESWELVKTKPDYDTIVGAKMLKALFAYDPQAAAPFGIRSRVRALTEEKIRNHDALIQHAVRLLVFLDAALCMTGTSSKTLLAMLKDVGRRHLRYGAKHLQIPIMGEALVDALQEFLGKDHWSKALEDAWLEVMDVISRHVVIGMVQQTQK